MDAKKLYFKKSGVLVEATQPIPEHLHHISTLLDVVVSMDTKRVFVEEFDAAYEYLMDEYRKIAESQFNCNLFTVGILNEQPVPTSEVVEIEERVEV